MNFNIRKATVDDADGMAMVHVTSWQQTYRGLIHPDFINERTLDKSKHMFLSTQCKNTIVIENHGTNRRILRIWKLSRYRYDLGYR
jgi:hypothetical protein